MYYITSYYVVHCSLLLLYNITSYNMMLPAGRPEEPPGVATAGGRGRGPLLHDRNLYISNNKHLQHLIAEQKKKKKSILHSK